MTREYRQHVFQPPEGALDLLLIRHGESEAARPGVPFPSVNGQGDPALHAQGRQQAEAVGRRLAADRFDAVYVTPLRRTQETAAPLLQRLGIVAETEADLREIFLGDWDKGEYRIRAAEGDPVFRQVFQDEEWGLIPGAETTAALRTRVHAALERLRLRHRNQRVAAFVHGGVIGAAMAIATGSRPFAFNGAANASISRIVLTEERYFVQAFNDTSHLLTQS